MGGGDRQTRGLPLPARAVRRLAQIQVCARSGVRDRGVHGPQGSRHGFGALLIGYYRGDELLYAGKVGTGFDDELLDLLTRRLARIERQRSPFTIARLALAGVHWVKPELVAQIGLTEWTRDGQLRHPRFLGLREDKGPHEVVRERPA